jgi:zinc protease
VAALTRRRLAEIYARRYPIERLTLAVVGAVDPAQLLRRAEALLPPAAAPAPQPEPSPMDSHPRVHGRYPLPESDPLPSAPLQVIKHGGRQQAHITAGFRGITLADPDRPALLLLTTLLSAPFGRLNAELRDRRGLVYGAAAASMEGADPGYLAIHLAASPEKAEAAQVALRDELRRLTDHEVAPEELARARRHLIGSLELSRQRPGDLAHALALSETCGPGWSQASRLADSIERVTAADVQRAARRYLDERHGVLAAVLPESPTPAASRRTVTEHQPEQRPAPPASARQAAPARKRGR